jgi:hypothetical protein
MNARRSIPLFGRRETLENHLGTLSLPHLLAATFESQVDALLVLDVAACGDHRT